MNTRVFAYDSREFADPDPSLTTEEVKLQFAQFFPELQTAEIRTVQKDADTTAYEFIRKTGTKSALILLTPSMVVAALKTVPEYHIDLIDLANKFARDDGTLDDVQLALHSQEVDEAVEQANTYIKSVRNVINRLAHYLGR
jgi:PRTRC genetic system protein C